MRLLFVTQDFPPDTGGIETYSYELSKRFHASVEFFSVLAPAHNKANLIDKGLSYPVFRVPFENSLLPLTSIPYLIHYVQRYSFDTIFHAQWQTVLASLLSRKLTGFPRHIYVAAHARELLLSPYAGNGGWFSHRLHRWRQVMFGKVDGFFPVSRYTASLLEQEGVSPDRIHVVGNGTDPEFFMPQKTLCLRNKLGAEQKKVIFSVCRLVRRKGMDLVLQSLKDIVRNRQDVVYVIGGSGPDEQRLRSLVADMQLDDYVHFTGRIPDEQLPDYYSMADVFVMPAKNDPPDVEGFGIVFLEANACGTPVIGSNTGGIPDAVRHGETGYLIEEGDAGRLTELLIQLLNNDKLAKEMGAAGRERILTEATWDHVAATLLKKVELINAR